MHLLKWAGSKHGFVEKYGYLLPKPSEIKGAYGEPFLGGGAVADVYIGRAPCVLNDSNARLIAMYRGVRDEPELVIDALRQYVFNKECYYRTRKEFNLGGAPDWRVAAQLIYLNRTCFNGLYRENADGEFNVPIGKYKNPNFCNEALIRDVSRRLRAAPTHLLAQDYTTILDSAGKDDFLFIDSPYVPASATANFTSYTSGGFGPEDQQRLADRLHTLKCHWILTNADNDMTRALYAGWHMMGVTAPRSINSKGDKRGEVPELIVSNRSFVEWVDWCMCDGSRHKRGFGCP